MSKGQKRRKIDYALLATVMILTVPVASKAQYFQPEKHPNHYIILVDSSGSTASSKAKREAYNKALTETLPKLIYETGFGQAIPPLELQNDILTLLHFGVVSSGPIPAYMRLKDYDLTKDFIHTVTFRSLDISQSEFKRRAPPTQHYELTILSWAKQMALSVFNAKNSNAVNNRTFLIMISDGIANGGISAREIETAENFGNHSNVEQVKGLVNTIDREYLFTDGQGKDGRAFQEKLPNDNHPLFFIEAYEVVSVAQAKWEAEAKALQPLNRLKIEWTKESGAAPEGVLVATIENDLLKQLGLTGDATGVMKLMREGSKNEAAWYLGSHLKMPFSIQEALTCDSRNFDALLEIPITQTDGRLGTRNVNYVFRQSISAPPATSCTVMFFVWTGAKLLLLAAVLFAIVYLIYFRLYSTHLDIELPGLRAPIRLNRKSGTLGGTSISPKEELEALSLRLPNQLLQRIFYQKALVRLEANVDSVKEGKDKEGKDLVHWTNDSSSSSTLKLPSDLRNITASWQDIPKGPTKLTVIFKQGGQHSEVVLSYPKGISKQEDKNARPAR